MEGRARALQAELGEHEKLGAAARARELELEERITAAREEVEAAAAAGRQVAAEGKVQLTTVGERLAEADAARSEAERMLAAAGGEAAAEVEVRLCIVCPAPGVLCGDRGLPLITAARPQAVCAVHQLQLAAIVDFLAHTAAAKGDALAQRSEAAGLARKLRAEQAMRATEAVQATTAARRHEELRQEEVARLGRTVAELRRALAASNVLAASGGGMPPGSGPRVTQVWAAADRTWRPFGADGEATGSEASAGEELARTDEEPGSGRPREGSAFESPDSNSYELPAEAEALLRQASATWAAPSVQQLEHKLQGLARAHRALQTPPRGPRA